MANKGMKQGGYVFITLALIVLMALVALLLPTRVDKSWWLWAWIINVFLMFLVFGTIGLSVGSKAGFWAVFVDNRNMVSLSRFQIVLWTLVILSAFWTIALGRIGDSTKNQADYACQPQTGASSSAPAGTAAPANETPCAAPADLQVPPILWALLGISVTSSVASPLIKENNARSGSAQYVKKDPETPEFADMFHGEIENNKDYVDMAKVQNFFFTVVAVVTYAVAIGVAFIGAQSIASFFQFPAISTGLVTILGISHVGYLTSKVVTK